MKSYDSIIVASNDQKKNSSQDDIPTSKVRLFNKAVKNMLGINLKFHDDNTKKDDREKYEPPDETINSMDIGIFRLQRGINIESAEISDDQSVTVTENDFDFDVDMLSDDRHSTGPSTLVTPKLQSKLYSISEILNDPGLLGPDHSQLAKVYFR